MKTGYARGKHGTPHVGTHRPMQPVPRFRTKLGYCEIYPDRLVLVDDDAVIAETAERFGMRPEHLHEAISRKRRRAARRWWIPGKFLRWLALVAFGIIVARVSREAHAVLSGAELFVLLIIGFGFLLSALTLVSVALRFIIHAIITHILRFSTVREIPRRAMHSVRIRKAFPPFTRAFVSVLFEDARGWRWRRLIPLPGSMTGGVAAEQEALRVLRSASLL